VRIPSTIASSEGRLRRPQLIAGGSGTPWGSRAPSSSSEGRLRRPAAHRGGFGTPWGSRAPSSSSGRPASPAAAHRGGFGTLGVPSTILIERRPASPAAAHRGGFGTLGVPSIVVGNRGARAPHALFSRSASCRSRRRLRSMSTSASPPARRAGVLLPLFSIRTPQGWGLGGDPRHPPLRPLGEQRRALGAAAAAGERGGGGRDQPLRGGHRLRPRSHLPRARRLRGLRRRGAARAPCPPRIAPRSSSCPPHRRWTGRGCARSSGGRRRAPSPTSRPPSGARAARGRASCGASSRSTGPGSTTTPCTPSSTIASRRPGGTGPSRCASVIRSRCERRAPPSPTPCWRRPGCSGSSTSSGTRPGRTRRRWG
jgi:hypothetical protein